MADTTVNIGAYKTRFGARFGVFKRGVLIKLFSSVIKDTPVLTGRLRGNWVFSVGEPATNIPDVKSNGPHENVLPVVTQAIKSQVTNEDNSYFLTNSLPYANRIEYEGWSHTKAPEGMVRKNIVRIAGILAEEVTK